jgi:hypothetical protein
VKKEKNEDPAQILHSCRYVRISYLMAFARRGLNRPIPADAPLPGDTWGEPATASQPVPPPSSESLYLSYKKTQYDHVLSTAGTYSQEFTFAVPRISPQALSSVLRRLVDVLNDGIRYQVNFKGSPIHEAVAARLTGAEFHLDRVKSTVRISPDSDYVLAYHPLDLGHLPRQGPTDVHRRKFRSFPPMPPNHWQNLGRGLFAKTKGRPTDSPARGDGESVEAFVLRKFGDPPKVFRTIVADATSQDYIGMRLPGNFDVTDFNACHCMVVHREHRDRSPAEVVRILIALLIRVGISEKGRRWKQWKPGLVDYLFRWLFLFPEDFEEFPAADLLAGLNHKEQKVDLEDRDVNFFASDDVRAYAVARAAAPLAYPGGEVGKHLKDCMFRQHLPLACANLSKVERAIAGGIRCRDLIRLDQDPPPAAVLAYFQRMDDTIASVGQSLVVTEDSSCAENFASWMRLLLECQMHGAGHGNLQLAFEILSGLGRNWDKENLRRAFFAQASREQLAEVNAIVELYSASEDFKSQFLLLAKSDKPHPQSLGFFLPVLYRIKDLLRQAFGPGASPEKWDGSIIRAIYDFSMLILRAWRVEYGEIDCDPLLLLPNRRGGFFGATR